MSSREPLLDLSDGPEPSQYAAAISFTIGSDVYTVDSARVAEIIHPLSVTQLPNMPPAIRGVAANRGEIIALLDLPTALGTGPVTKHRPKWLVLNAEHGRTRFAVEVENVNQLLSDPRDGDSAGRSLDIDAVIAEIGGLIR